MVRQDLYLPARYFRYVQHMQDTMAYFTDTTNAGATTASATSSLAGALIVIMLLTVGCGDDFLAPQPKSFMTDEILSEKEGLEAVVVDLNRALRTEFHGGHMPLLTEHYFTDIAVSAGSAQEAVWPQDLVNELTPTGDLDFVIKSGAYWNHGYRTISTANLLISNIENVEDWSSEAEKDAMLAAGYFHRAYWYYRLVHQFGDVPLYLESVEEPRLDFNTYSRDAVLNKIREDVEFAVEHLPDNARPGEVNRAAGYYLLTKIYLSLREFQDAVDAASQVIDGGSYDLMTERFGQGAYADDPEFNVLWDLHQKENKSISDNVEAILVVQDKLDIDGSVEGGSQITRYLTPRWWFGTVVDPNGYSATTAGPSGNPLSDSLGRGISAIRTNDYFNYELRENSGDGDLRYSDVNWFSMDEYWYNEPDSEYYGEPFVRGAVQDTTYTWYPFMYNKVYISDELRNEHKMGGHTDWYVYRLAGLYLLRAEAYYWLGQMDQAAEDINAVRERAEAAPVDPGDVTIDYIFDERARELYFEEPRQTEMTRVSYIMAQLGQDGYSLENMHQDNWFYDRVMDKNIYYREQLHIGVHQYRMEPYHVYWPIPQDEIDSNVHGFINQAEGYAGSENNEQPLETIDEDS